LIFIFFLSFVLKRNIEVWLEASDGASPAFPRGGQTPAGCLEARSHAGVRPAPLQITIRPLGRCCASTVTCCAPSWPPLLAELPEIWHENNNRFAAIRRPGPYTWAAAAASHPPPAAAGALAVGAVAVGGFCITAAAVSWPCHPKAEGVCRAGAAACPARCRSPATAGARPAGQRRHLPPPL